MTTHCKPSYPALELAASNDRNATVKRGKGFFVFFVIVVLATVAGIVCFLLFISTELPVLRGPVSEENRDVRDLLSGYGKSEKEKAVPFIYYGTHEKNTYQTTPYK